jgi:hypothetical protein
MHEDLIGWLHEMAAMGTAEIERCFDAAQNSRLIEFFNVHLADGYDAPEQLSASEFAKVILDLRESERQWNRALGDAIIKAEDLSSSGRRSEAAFLLKEFAEQCGWRSLKTIALSEAARHTQ